MPTAALRLAMGWKMGDQLWGFILFLFWTFNVLFASCEKCSEALHKTFKRGFNLTENCDECKILLPWIHFLGEDWGGFCVKNTFFLFDEWKCREENELKANDSFVMVTEGFCEHLQGNHSVDMQCFGQFNSEVCNRKSELSPVNNIEEEKNGKRESFLHSGGESSGLIRGEVIQLSSEDGITTAKPFFKRMTTTKTTLLRTTEKSTTTLITFPETFSAEVTLPEIGATVSTSAQMTSSETVLEEPAAEFSSTETAFEETTAESSRTENKSTESLSTRMTFTETLPTETLTASTSEQMTITCTTSSLPRSTPSSENTVSLNSTSRPYVQNACEPNEFFYNDHCYFIKPYGESPNDSERSSKVPDKFSSYEEAAVNLMKSCQVQHPRALALAVETKEENKFILAALRTIYFYGGSVILTSGVTAKGGLSEWVGWDLKVNHTVLNFQQNNLPSNSPYAFYCINSCRNYWYLFTPTSPHVTDLTFYVVCERPYNPKNTQSELHKQCLELYRKSRCYRLDKHENFCCAKDEHGEIWFACPNVSENKYYPDAVVCTWACRDDGFFSQDRPTCKGKFVCSESHRNVRYIAPIKRYALSSCPTAFSGHSSWYCGPNRTFLGTPDYSLCCERNLPKCKDIDVFLNVWMGCPSKKIVKRTACPPGAIRSEALVEWYCQENGTFLGSTPDYSNCHKTDLMCSKADRFQVLWTAVPGTIAKKTCPPSFTGHCFWKCKNSGMFEGFEPDCSKCKAAWMDEIAEKIKNQAQHEEVMAIMENYTKTEDLRIGFGHVLNLTSDCVKLYKRQIDKKDIFCAFDKFLRSYSKILKNIAGDTNIWLSFSESSREEYVSQILNTTQNAAFANLEIKNATKEHYNSTFATSGVDGFDFFVAYNPSLETDFPLQDFSHSDWHLKIKKVNQSAINFAAMGLIMNYSLSSLMFPRGNETKDLELNAPTVTFTVAAATNGEVVIDPNVVVVISFKHANRTRFPAVEVIRRKLHAGEHPSGVFNSTLCYFYRDSDWSTEGCWVTHTSRDRTNCTCNHLSTIALLMSIHKYQRNRILEFVSAVSSGITVVALILSLLVFHFVDKGSNERVLIGKNLCLCLLIGHVMLFSVMDKKFFNISDTLCRTYAILLHYVFMAAFSWMFVEGCHIYRMLVLVFDSNIDYRRIYLSIGYGVPLIVVGTTQLVGFIFQEQPYGQDELCWLQTPNYVWAFIGPVLVSTSINFCILTVALKLAVSSKRRTEKCNFSTLKVWVKGWISLSALLGITWLFGLGYIRYNETFVYVFIVFNGLQGFFIFLFRCVLCEQYRAVFVGKFKSWFWDSTSIPKEMRRNEKQGTKVYVVSSMKSSSDVTEAKDSGYETTIVSGSEKEDRKSFLHRFANRGPNRPKANENLSGNGIDINVTLTPAMAEAYLRNRMISKNFSARKSKASWLADPENFPELSYHGTSSKN